MSALRNSFTFVLAALGIIAVVATSDAAQDDDPPVIKVDSGNPVSGQPEAIEAGRKLYGRWCRQCHGAKLDGYSPRWGKHGADLRKFWRGYKEFVTIVQDGLPKKQMPPHKEYISEDEILTIGAFIETKAIEGANWK